MPRASWPSKSVIFVPLIAVSISYILFSALNSQIQSLMFQRFSQIANILKPSTSQVCSMSAANGLPSSWHAGPDDGFHGKITEDGPFKPEKGRYHLYIGLFCPFAHRANLVLHLKQLDKYAGTETSIVKPYPKGDDKVRPSRMI